MSNFADKGVLLFQAIQGSLPLTQSKRRDPGKVESDGERSTRSSKAKDIATLKGLMALDEKERLTREKSKGRKKDTADEESIEIPTEMPAEGSRRGRKRQVRIKELLCCSTIVTVTIVRIFGCVFFRQAQMISHSRHNSMQLRRLHHLENGETFMLRIQMRMQLQVIIVLHRLRLNQGGEVGNSSCSQTLHQCFIVDLIKTIYTAMWLLGKIDSAQTGSSKKPPRPRTRAAVEAEGDDEI